MALILAGLIERRENRPYWEFVCVLFVATLPVAYFQCLNDSTSLMPLLWDWLHPNVSPWFTDGWNTGTYALFFLVTSTATFYLLRKKEAQDAR